MSQPKFLGCVYNQILIPMVLRCACFARLKAPTKFSFKNFKADTELKTTIMDHRSVAFHPARNLRQAATKERLTTKEASTNGSCSLHFIELSHCFLLLLFFFQFCHDIHRGYYMAAWRYEISPRVLKNISRVNAANE